MHAGMGHQRCDLCKQALLEHVPEAARNPFMQPASLLWLQTDPHQGLLVCSWLTRRLFGNPAAERLATVAKHLKRPRYPLRVLGVQAFCGLWIDKGKCLMHSRPSLACRFAGNGLANVGIACRQRRQAAPQGFAVKQAATDHKRDTAACANRGRRV